MVTVIQEFGVGGAKPPDLRHFLQGGSSGDPPIWIGGIGDDPQDREDPQRITPKVGPQSGGNAAEFVHGRVVRIPASGRIHGGGGARGGGYIFPPPLEHHHPVYRDPSNTGAMSSSGMETRSTGVMAVVGAGRDRPGARRGKYG